MKYPHTMRTDWSHDIRTVEEKKLNAADNLGVVF